MNVRAPLQAATRALRDGGYAERASFHDIGVTLRRVSSKPSRSMCKPDVAALSAGAPA